jgi:hypothetical protein
MSSVRSWRVEQKDPSLGRLPPAGAGWNQSAPKTSSSLLREKAMTEPLRVRPNTTARHDAAPWWAVIAVSIVVVLGVISLFNGGGAGTSPPAATSGQAPR